MEQVAKRRFQGPRPFREGHFWWITPWQDVFQDGKLTRKRTRMKVAEATTPEREARKIAAELLRPMNQGLQMVGSATPFSVYVESTYRPTVLPLLASTTRSNYQYTLAKYLMPSFSDTPLRDLSPMTLQKYFSGLQASHATAAKIKDVLGSVLGSALRFGLLAKNPLSAVKLRPPRTAKRTKPTITPEQFEALVNLMTEPYASMAAVSVMTGLRVSELIALKWEDVHADSLTIDERYCRGDWACPKTTASSATIGVDESVIARIQRLKELETTINCGAHGAKKTFKLVRSSAPQDLVFQSVKTGAPMSDHNILSRHIKPAARQLGIGFVNWQVLRRSYATWLVQSGADPKSVQGQMRHSRISTTMEIYAQTVPESQRRAVSGLSAMVSERIAKGQLARAVTALIQ
jgi:integrase